MYNKLNKFLLLVLIIGNFVLADKNLDRYLSKKLEFVNDKLSGRVSRRDLNADITFKEEKTVSIANKYAGGHSFTLFDKVYLLLDYEIFLVLPEDNKFVLVTQATFTKIHGEILFIETAQYKDFALMLVVFKDGKTNIYKYQIGALQPEYIHSIKTSINITDAIFFVNDGSMYLLTSSISKHSESPMIAYKWVGSHFDEIEKVNINGVISLTSFSYQDSEYIIALRNVGVKSNSYVYEFNSDKLRMQQVLDNGRPKHIATFSNEGKRYATIFDEAGYNTLYWFNGYEFVTFQNFDRTSDFQKVAIEEINNSSLILATRLDKINIYYPHLSSVKLLSSFQFKESYSKIFNLETIQYNNSQLLFILGLKNNTELSFTVLEFIYNQLEGEIIASEEDEFLECIQNLETLLDEKEVKMPTKKIIKNEAIEMELNKTTENVEFFAKNTAEPLLGQSQTEFDFNAETVKQLEDEIKLAEEKTLQLMPISEELSKLDTTVINATVDVNGGIFAESLVSDKLNTEIINNFKWNPENWLSYSKDQTISGEFFIENLLVDKLLTAADDKIFKDMLLLNSLNTQVLKGANLKSLQANNINATKINNIDFENVYLRSQPVKITGIKTIENVIADEVTLEELNGKNISDIIKIFGDTKAMKYEFLSNLNIKDLHIEKINGIDWTEFSESVFRVGQSQTIEGNLTFLNLDVENFMPKLISGFDSTQLLTTSTNQTVNSVINFGNVNTGNLLSNKINGLHFEKDVAYFGENENTHIIGPVSIKNIEIINNLQINGSIEDFYRENNISETDQNDLLQIYNNNVKIVGNLHLKNLNLFQLAKLYINDNEFNPESFINYWQKSKDQDIPVQFEALRGISTPHLTANMLNGIPIDDYMINNLDDKQYTNYYFSNVTVLGNIIINNTVEHQPDLEKLERDSVKLNGTFEIRGSKTFKGKVTVVQLETDYINSTKVADWPTKNSQEILGTILFDNLIVQEDVTTDAFSTDTINGHNFTDLLENVLYIDEPISLEKLNFANVTVQNLTASTVNGKHFNQYLAELEELDSMKALKRCTVKGDVVIKNVVGLNSINEVNITEKMIQAVNNDPIKGNVTFEGKVHVKDLSVQNINGINYEDLLPRLYYRDWAQNLTAKHTFKTITAPDVITPRINDLNVQNLINTKSPVPQIIIAENGMRMHNPTFLKSLNGDYNECDIETAANSIFNIQSQSWKSVQVLGNVTILDELSSLGNLIKNAVRANEENIISAPVTFNNVYAENISCLKNVNGININEIIEDAVFINGEEQVITGYKTFSKLSTTSAVVYGNIDIPIVNEINITELNNSIITKDTINTQTISGHKTLFGGLETNILEAKTIIGFNPENLVSLDNLQPIPKATFDTLHITNNLNLNYIYQNKNFTEFLNNRLLINSDYDQVTSAIYFIDELKLNGPSYIPNINNIRMEDVVFDHGLQIITAPKTFNGNLFINGNTIIESVNGFHLNELYQKSMFLNSESHITGNMRLNAFSEINGTIWAQNINGVAIERIHEMLNTKNPQIRREIVYDTIKNIGALVDDSLTKIQKLPDQYLYLEKADKLQLELPNTVDAQIINNRDKVLIHIKSEDVGNICGLPSDCLCLNQKTYWITPQYSINAFNDKNGFRVFSYEDNEVSIHVATTTKSSSYFCRTADSVVNENTIINWVTTSSGNNSLHSHPERILGYISAVKFFSLEGYRYIILSRFYDSLSNSHDITCLVLRLSKNLNDVESIQELPCNGAWTLHVFPTAQGMNLVIGSIGSYNYNDGELSTDIYRFDQTTKMFNPLKKIIGSGCLSITSVVLTYDSLIILAHVNAPMQILKYNSDDDNYHFYQNFVQEHPVHSVSAFYTSGAGISDAFLTAVTNNGHFYIYSYQYLAGWKKESEGQIDGLKSLTPFILNKISYLFAASTHRSSILKIVKQGYN